MKSASRRVQIGCERGAAAENALGQNIARHDTKIANGEDWQMPATIDDPAILDEITEALKTLGYPCRDCLIRRSSRE